MTDQTQFFQFGGRNAGKNLRRSLSLADKLLLAVEDTLGIRPNDKDAAGCWDALKVAADNYRKVRDGTEG